MNKSNRIYSVILVFIYYFFISLILFIADSNNMLSAFLKIEVDISSFFIIFFMLVFIYLFLIIKYLILEKEEDILFRIIISLPFALLTNRVLIHVFKGEKTFIIILMALLILCLISIVLYIKYCSIKNKKTKDTSNENSLSSMMSDNYLESEYYILSDKPISDNSDDVINTEKYIFNIKKYIFELCKPNKSLIIGLIGEWGSGKSSIINQIMDENIIYYSSWEYDSPKLMLKSLYKMIYNKIRSKSKISDILKIDIYFNDYEKIINEYVKKKTSIDFTSYKDDKSKIDKLLSNQEKIIVIIDDIDRLHEEKYVMLFDFIYNVVNFNNINFIICYDERRLESYCDTTKNSYLDKIVNSKIYVPRINPDMIEDVLNKSIDNVLKKYGIKIDEEKNIYKRVIRIMGSSFDNIRDIVRFINSLQMDLLFCINDSLYYIDVIIVSFIKYKYNDDFIKIYNNLKQLLIKGPTKENTTNLNEKTIQLLHYLFYLKSFDFPIEEKTEKKQIYYKKHRCMFEDFAYNYFTQGESKETKIFVKVSEYMGSVDNKIDRIKSINSFIEKNSDNVDLIYKYLGLYLDVENPIHKDLFLGLVNHMSKSNYYDYSLIYKYIDEYTDPSKLISNINDVIILDQLYINYTHSDKYSEEKIKLGNIISDRIRDIFIEKINNKENIFNKKNYVSQQLNIFYTYLQQEYQNYTSHLNSMLNYSNVFRVVYDCMEEIRRYNTKFEYIYKYYKERVINYGFNEEKLAQLFMDKYRKLKIVNDDQKKLYESYISSINFDSVDEKAYLNKINPYNL